nr:MAG TPA: hypothetical protein [Caudoviricetes sp.]
MGCSLTALILYNGEADLSTLFSGNLYFFEMGLPSRHSRRLWRCRRLCRGYFCFSPAVHRCPRENLAETEIFNFS